MRSARGVESSLPGNEIIHAGEVDNSDSTDGFIIT